MASGKVHDRWIVVTSSILAGVALSDALRGYLASGAIPETSWQSGAAAIGCLFGGLYLSPDLDLPTSNPVNRWGWLAGLWIPYEALFKHRSIWSHGPIIGAFIRAIYFLMLAILLFAVADFLMSGGQWLPKSGLVDWLIKSIANNPKLAGWLYIGLNIADGVHLFLDLTVKNRSYSDGQLHGIQKGD